jgi:hypothetical protein
LQWNNFNAGRNEILTNTVEYYFKRD